MVREYTRPQPDNVILYTTLSEKVKVFLRICADFPRNFCTLVGEIPLHHNILWKRLGKLGKRRGRTGDHSFGTGGGGGVAASLRTLPDPVRGRAGRRAKTPAFVTLSSPKGYDPPFESCFLPVKMPVNGVFCGIGDNREHFSRFFAKTGQKTKKKHCKSRARMLQYLYMGKFPLFPFSS